MIKTNKKMVFDYLDSVDRNVVFHGRDLKDHIFFATGKDPYTETVLKYARDYCCTKKATLVCLNKQKSLYSFSPEPLSHFKLGVN